MRHQRAQAPHSYGSNISNQSKIIHSEKKATEMPENTGVEAKKKNKVHNEYILMMIQR